MTRRCDSPENVDCSANDDRLMVEGYETLRDCTEGDSESLLIHIVYIFPDEM